MLEESHSGARANTKARRLVIAAEVFERGTILRELPAEASVLLLLEPRGAGISQRPSDVCLRRIVTYNQTSPGPGFAMSEIFSRRKCGSSSESTVDDQKRNQPNPKRLKGRLILRGD